MLPTHHLKKGDNVTVPIPDVDKGCTELRNVMAIVLNKTDDNLYKLGTENGVLSALYCRSQLQATKENF